MKKNKMTLIFVFLNIVLLLSYIFCKSAVADYNVFLSSPNPVGSGARALGMGGAFIGIADDATAASWNPGGLVQLKKPEISVVGSFVWRNDNYDTSTAEETLASQQIFSNEINYLSIVYPFSLLNRNMVLSLNYQRLYDFTLKQDSTINEIVNEYGMIYSVNINTNRNRTGSLAPLGVAYSLQITPQISFGITLNFWKSCNDINKVVEKFITVSAMDGQAVTYDFMEVTSEFDGFNSNIGLLLRPFDQLSIGIVYKSQFDADIERKKYDQLTLIDISLTTTDTNQLNETLKMPESYGIGFCYKASDVFKLSADIYLTNWENYIYINEDNLRFSPITGFIESESEVDATIQIRTGLEYLVVNPTKQLTIPIRFGLFSDPIPDKGSPINVYGGSVGTGISIGHWAMDAFYQYKFSQDINTIEGRAELLPKEIDEHTMYFSIIYYL